MMAKEKKTRYAWEMPAPIEYVWVPKNSGMADKFKNWGWVPASLVRFADWRNP